MSGLARKLKREQQKAQYKRFARAWNDEKTFQEYLVKTGQAQVVEKVKDNDRIKVLIGGPDGNESAILGRKPTFSMWSKNANRMPGPMAGAAPPQDKKVEVTDTSWDEGG